MEQRFGPLADAALTREGIVTDDVSRGPLMGARQFGLACNCRSQVHNKVLGSSLSQRRG